MVRELIKKYTGKWKNLSREKPFVERTYDPTEIRRPVVQQFDCLVAPITYTIASPFHFVERAIIDFRYATNSDSFIKFGVDAALANGVQIWYDGRELFHMTSTACLGEFAYDVSVLIDDAATKVHTVHSRYSFFKIKTDGLRVNDTEKLELRIVDDLSGSSNISLTFTFEGWVQ